MPDDPTKKPGDDAGDKAEALTRDDVIAIVNGTVNTAITGHLKRQKTDLEKAIADSVAKALAAAPKGDERQPGAEGASDAKGSTTAGKGGAVDPEVKLLKEQLEALKRKSDEAEARAKATEEKARREKARAQLREALEAEGIKPAHARALIADFEANNAVRFDEDGTPIVAVKRARQKDAEPEELEFTDFTRAVKDWTKSEDAKEWLPAPGSKTPIAQGKGAANGAKRVGTPTAHDKPPASFEESVARLKQHLDAQGADSSDLLND